MSKKKAGTTKRPMRKPRRVASPKVLSAALLVSVAAAVAALAPLRRAPSPAVAPPQQQGALSLAKEYVYVGGRLIATEEPTSGGPPPTNFLATATSATVVALTWTAPAGSINSYQVERSQSASDPFTPLTPNSATTSFTDTTASPGTAYLYRVRALYTAGGHSDYSNKDLATTVVFTDDPLAAGVTPVRALHLTELRQAVNAVRATAALSAATWTDPSPAGATVKAAHVTELRTSLDQALSALGLPLHGYTDPTLSAGATTVKKAHFEELRQRVK